VTPTDSMKAAVHDRYGPPDVLRLEEVERPVPGSDEVLVEVRATTVNRTDTHMRAARPFLWRFMLGLRRPKRRVLGLEFAGEVAAVGASVTEFEVGDRVFGMRSGSHAEYVCVREAGVLAHIPAGMSFEEATAVCDGGTQALAPLTRAGVGENTRLLVYGASGSCGTAAVQLAKHHLGAHVTAVCNTKNVELVRSLGADEVIDYLRDDFTKNGETYDVILDAVGKHSFFRSRGSLTARGLFLATDGLHNFPLALVTSRIGDRKVVFTIARPTKQDARLLKRLVEAGEYRPVIDRTQPFEEIVEAHRYVDTLQKTGNVVLTLDGGPAQ
jgi:NADPH:quinone reductase-like Zn-dependent oxidoreductase